MVTSGSTSVATEDCTAAASDVMLSALESADTALHGKFGCGAKQGMDCPALDTH